MENNEIKVVENFLTKDECFHILKKCKLDIDLSVAQIIDGQPKSRKSSIGWINDLGYLNERLKDVLKDSYFFDGMQVTGLGPFQFTEYKKGEYYDWHVDRESTTLMDRFTSTVIQLNDNYYGGILEIKNSKGDLVSIENKIGNLYIFDSNLRHRVSPVEDGVRYSLVNWISIIKTDPTQQKLI